MPTEYPMQFPHNPRTRWTATHAGNVLYTSHNGEYLFVSANARTTPLVTIRRNGRKWYVRLTANFGLVPHIIAPTTKTTTRRYDIPLDDPHPTTKTTKTTTPVTSFTDTDFRSAVRTATLLCLEHLRRK